MRAGIAENITEKMNEQETRLNFMGDALAVHGQRDQFFHDGEIPTVYEDITASMRLLALVGEQ